MACQVEWRHGDHSETAEYDEDFDTIWRRVNQRAKRFVDEHGGCELVINEDDRVLRTFRYCEIS